jgi:serine protease Do
MARKIKDQLIATGEVRRGHIGVVIQDMNQDLARSLDIEKPEGILVAGVSQGSAGDQAGLEQGDVILKLNDDDVGSVQTFRSRIASTLPGTEVALQVLRDGKVRDFVFALGALDGAVAGAQPPGDVLGRLGLAVGELTRDLAMRFDYDLGSGVLVTEVKAGSEAARNRIEPGNLISSVNRMQVRSVPEFERALAEVAGEDLVLLLVTDGRATRFVALRLDG